MDGCVQERCSDKLLANNHVSSTQFEEDEEKQVPTTTSPQTKPLPSRPRILSSSSLQSMKLRGSEEARTPPNERTQRKTLSRSVSCGQICDVEGSGSAEEEAGKPSTAAGARRTSLPDPSSEKNQRYSLTTWLAKGVKRMVRPSKKKHISDASNIDLF
jgi:hypothetical protein